MKGLVTNIQRFSLNDGDGIRTTVFLKGCNMKCEWCHNPETLRGKSELMFYENKCIGCGKCYKACPTHAHKCENGKHTIDRKLCVNCGKCADVCYAEALVMCGTEMDVEQVMHDIRQDIPYYENSGGGVTISGGEVLCQRDFAIAICCACHKEGIKVAVETNLSYNYEYTSELLKETDLIMCDLKLIDDSEHIKYTGISNKQILKNIKKINELDIPIIVRTPLIPGATDKNENIIGIAEYISGMKNLKRYELLNFNPMGEGKYKGLDIKNTFEHCRPLGPKRLKEISDLLHEIGIEYKMV